MKELLFKVVSPMDRIKGAQEHFGKGFTTGKIIIVSIVVIAIIAFITFAIIQTRKK
jgi:hypothetical protein